MIFLLIKSLVMGFVMAAPVGPVGVLCLRRSLKSGWLVGFVTGFAVAICDGLFGLVSSLGLNSITDFLKDHQQPVRLVGGVILLLVAFFIFRSPPANLESKDDKDASESAVGVGLLFKSFFSALLLALSNPLAIFSFAAIYLSLGLGSEIASEPSLIFIFVVGIVVGSCGWWAVLSVGAAHFRERLSDHVLKRINQSCGALVAVFGAWSLVSGFVLTS